jgi:hypothetical protein
MILVVSLRCVASDHAGYSTMGLVSSLGLQMAIVNSLVKSKFHHLWSLLWRQGALCAMWLKANPLPSPPSHYSMLTARWRAGESVAMTPADSDTANRKDPPHRSHLHLAPRASPLRRGHSPNECICELSRFVGICFECSISSESSSMATVYDDNPNSLRRSGVLLSGASLR